MNQSKERLNSTYTPLAELGPDHVGKSVLLKARVQTSRPTGIIHI